MRRDDTVIVEFEDKKSGQTIEIELPRSQVAKLNQPGFLDDIFIRAGFSKWGGMVPKDQDPTLNKKPYSIGDLRKAEGNLKVETPPKPAPPRRLASDPNLNPDAPLLRSDWGRPEAVKATQQRQKVISAPWKSLSPGEKTARVLNTITALPAQIPVFAGQAVYHAARALEEQVEEGALKSPLASRIAKEEALKRLNADSNRRAEALGFLTENAPFGPVVAKAAETLGTYAGVGDIEGSQEAIRYEQQAEKLQRSIIPDYLKSYSEDPMVPIGRDILPFLVEGAVARIGARPGLTARSFRLAPEEVFNAPLPVRAYERATGRNYPQIIPPDEPIQTFSGSSGVGEGGAFTPFNVPMARPRVPTTETFTPSQLSRDVPIVEPSGSGDPFNLGVSVNPPVPRGQYAQARALYGRDFAPVDYRTSTGLDAATVRSTAPVTPAVPVPRMGFSAAAPRQLAIADQTPAVPAPALDAGLGSPLRQTDPAPVAPIAPQASTSPVQAPVAAPTPPAPLVSNPPVESPSVSPGFTSNAYTEFHNRMGNRARQIWGAKTAYTGDQTPVPYVYNVVELDDVVNSHTNDLKPDARYDQNLQNRPRTDDKFTQAWIAERSAPTKFNADELGTTDFSGTANQGPPIIGPDMQVESGNGRTMLLREIYNNPAKAESLRRYQENVRQVAKNAGIPLAGMQKPVLVRVRTNDLSDAQARYALAREMNKDPMMGKVASEEAFNDAAAMSSAGAFGRLMAEEGGGIGGEANAPFVRDAFGSLGATQEGAGLGNRESGTLSVAGENRIKNAILAYAFKDNPDLARKIIDGTITGVTALVNGVKNAINPLVRLKQLAENGQIADFDITPNIGEAIEIISAGRNGEAKQQGLTVDNYFRQIAETAGEENLFGNSVSKETGSLVELFSGVDPEAGRFYTNSAQNVSKFIDAYAKLWAREGQHQGTLGAAPTSATKVDLIRRADIEARGLGNDTGGFDFDAINSQEITPPPVSASGAVDRTPEIGIDEGIDVSVPEPIPLPEEQPGGRSLYEMEPDDSLPEAPPPRVYDVEDLRDRLEAEFPDVEERYTGLDTFQKGLKGDKQPPGPESFVATVDAATRDFENRRPEYAKALEIQAALEEKYGANIPTWARRSWVLRKLSEDPRVNVAKDGTIYYNGRPIESPPPPTYTNIVAKETERYGTSHVEDKYAMTLGYDASRYLIESGEGVAVVEHSRRYKQAAIAVDGRIYAYDPYTLNDIANRGEIIKGDTPDAMERDPSSAVGVPMYFDEPDAFYAVINDNSYHVDPATGKAAVGGRHWDEPVPPTRRLTKEQIDVIVEQYDGKKDFKLAARVGTKTFDGGGNLLTDSYTQGYFRNFGRIDKKTARKILNNINEMHRTAEERASGVSDPKRYTLSESKRLSLDDRELAGGSFNSDYYETTVPTISPERLQELYDKYNEMAEELPNFKGSRWRANEFTEQDARLMDGSLIEEADAINTMIRRILGHPNAPVDLLKSVVSNKSGFEGHWTDVAHNPEATGMLLRDPQFLDNAHWDIRTNPNKYIKEFEDFQVRVGGVEKHVSMWEGGKAKARAEKRDPVTGRTAKEEEAFQEQESVRLTAPEEPAPAATDTIADLFGEKRVEDAPTPVFTEDRTGLNATPEEPAPMSVADKAKAVEERYAAQIEAKRQKALEAQAATQEAQAGQAPIVEDFAAVEDAVARTPQKIVDTYGYDSLDGMASKWSASMRGLTDDDLRSRISDYNDDSSTRAAIAELAQRGTLTAEDLQRAQVAVNSDAWDATSVQASIDAANSETLGFIQEGSGDPAEAIAAFRNRVIDFQKARRKAMGYSPNTFYSRADLPLILGAELAETLTIGATYIAEGTVSFAKWAVRMKDANPTFNNDILKQLWIASKEYYASDVAPKIGASAPVPEKTVADYLPTYNSDIYAESTTLANAIVDSAVQMAQEGFVTPARGGYETKPLAVTEANAAKLAKLVGAAKVDELRAQGVSLDEITAAIEIMRDSALKEALALKDAYNQAAEGPTKEALKVESWSAMALANALELESIKNKTEWGRAGRVLQMTRTALDMGTDLARAFQNMFEGKTVTLPANAQDIAANTPAPTGDRAVPVTQIVRSDAPMPEGFETAPQRAKKRLPPRPKQTSAAGLSVLPGDYGPAPTPPKPKAFNPQKIQETIAKDQRLSSKVDSGKAKINAALKKLQRISSVAQGGLPADVVAELIQGLSEVAGAYIEAGIRSYAEYKYQIRQTLPDNAFKAISEDELQQSWQAAGGKVERQTPIELPTPGANRPATTPTLTGMDVPAPAVKAEQAGPGITMAMGESPTLPPVRVSSGARVGPGQRTTTPSLGMESSGEVSIPAPKARTPEEVEASKAADAKERLSKMGEQGTNRQLSLAGETGDVPAPAVRSTAPERVGSGEVETPDLAKPATKVEQGKIAGVEEDVRGQSSPKKLYESDRIINIQKKLIELYESPTNVKRDKSILRMLTEVGGYLYQEGFKNFDEWAIRMNQAVGQKIAEADLMAAYSNLQPNAFAKVKRRTDVRRVAIHRARKFLDVLGAEKALDEFSKVDPRAPDAAKQYSDILRKYHNSNWREKVMDGLGIPRALMTSFDVSAPFRQGIVFTLSRPWHSVPAFGKMLKAYASKDFAEEYLNSIANSENFDLYERFNVNFTEVGGGSIDIASREEAFMTNFFQDLYDRELFANRKAGNTGFRSTVEDVTSALLKPAAKGVAASERAYAVYLNTIRARVFDDFVRKYKKLGFDPDVNPELYEQTANWVNDATGRSRYGKIGPADFEEAAQVWGQAFFSGRFQVSRVQVLTSPARALRMPAPLRASVYGDLIRMFGVGATMLTTMYYAAKTLFPDRDVHIGNDITSADFGKLVIGDTRVDIWGGLANWVRFIAQQLYGYKTNEDGIVTLLDGKGTNPSIIDNAVSFTRSKLAPVPGGIIDAYMGKDAIGKEKYLGPPKVEGETAFGMLDPRNRERSVGEASQDILWNFAPMYAKEFKQAIVDDKDAATAALNMLQLFGVGVQTYRKDDYK